MTRQCVNCPGAVDHSTADCPVMRASLPVGVPDGWPRLERPAKVGAGVFSAGLSARLVVEAAYRQHEYAAEPPFSDGQIKSLAMLAAPTVKAEQVQCEECGGNGAGGDHEDDCSKAPSLPAAGLAVEEVEVVGWRDPSLNWSTISADNKAAHLAGESWRVASVRTFTEPLMTVAQHNRIVAALSAQQSAPERVSVQVKLLRGISFWLERTNEKSDEDIAELIELRALLASHGRGEA